MGTDEKQPEVKTEAPAADTPAVEVTPDPTQAAAPDRGATPTTSSDAPAATSGEKAAAPVEVNQHTRRDDNDVILGQWCDVVAGDYEGRRGWYFATVTSDPKTGYPATVQVRTRDAQNELIVLNYSDIRPTAYSGGR